MYNPYDVLAPAPLSISAGVNVTPNCTGGAGGLTFNESLACPSTIPGCNPCSIVVINNIKAQVAGLNSNIDGGNTQSLLATIATASAGNVKNALIAASPYLSDNVQITAYENNMPAGHVKQITIANSPVTAKVRNCIDGLGLPKGIRKQIDDAQTGTSVRRLLEAEISALETERKMLTNIVTSDYLRSGDVSTAITFLEGENTLDAHTALVPITAQYQPVKTPVSLAAIRQFADDLEIADNTNPQIGDLREYADLNELSLDLRQNDGYFSLTSTEEQTIRTIATGSGFAAIEAQNILKLVFDEDVEITPEPLDQLRLAQPQEEEPDVKEDLLNVPVVNEYARVYPNPAKESFTIQYNLQGEGIFRLYEITGRKMMESSLHEQGTINYNTNGLSNGLYFYTIVSNTNIIASSKLVVGGK